MLKYIVYIFIIITAISCNQERANREITSEEILDHIKYLSSDSLMGRFPGTEGDSLASAYIREQFFKYGLYLYENTGYQNFDAITGAVVGKNNFFKFDSIVAEPEKDYIPYSFSKDTTLISDIVFAGYGFDIDEDSLKWNDYKDIDVTGKWVLLLMADPELDNADSKFIPTSDERGKVLTAKDKGAAGVLFVAGSKLMKEDKLSPIYFDKIKSNSGLPVFNITRDLANSILKVANIHTNITNLEAGIIDNMMPNSFDIPIELEALSDVNLDNVHTNNVIGLILGNHSELSKEFIVVGAHYDHLGSGGPGSGSRIPDTTAVHNGADDNASGVAGIIELAGKLRGIRDSLKRSVIFIAFGGEEMGLLGSRFYVENPGVELSEIKGMVNLDMIGRLDSVSRSVLIGGSGTSYESDTLLKSLALNHDLSLSLSPGGFGASDHSSFYGKDIPVIFISTGAHSDYHTPDDDVDKIYARGEKMVLDYAFDLIKDLATRDSNLVFQESGAPSRKGGRGSKVTLGIMPDFAATETRGLRIDFVSNGGPAFTSGILKGDIITSINGMVVSNVYDYMSRMKKFKSGDIITVDVIRSERDEVIIIQL